MKAKKRKARKPKQVEPPITLLDVNEVMYDLITEMYARLWPQAPVNFILLAMDGSAAGVATSSNMETRDQAAILRALVCDPDFNRAAGEPMEERSIN